MRRVRLCRVGPDLTGDGGTFPVNKAGDLEGEGDGEAVLAKDDGN